MALTLPDIRHLFTTYGAMAYGGEPVTQLQHALQSAALAENAGAGEALVGAAFLHDLGHLLNLQGETPSARGIDDLHQYFALPFLRPLFNDAVLEPIRLHVDAKRCLCAIDAEYFSKLSADSVRSLKLQGGIFSEEEAEDSCVSLSRKMRFRCAAGTILPSNQNATHHRSTTISS